MDLEEKIRWNRNRPYTKSLWHAIQQIIIGTSSSGVVDKKTVEALAEYQTANGLLSDGLCGRLTLTHMLITHLYEPQGIMYAGEMDIWVDGSRFAHNSYNTGFGSNPERPSTYNDAPQDGIARDLEGYPFVWQCIEGNQYYVSSTDLLWEGESLWNPTAYVDAEHVPYITLNPILPHFHEEIRIGDVGLVFRLDDPTRRLPVICACYEGWPGLYGPPDFGGASIYCGEFFGIDMWEHDSKTVNGQNLSYKEVVRGSTDEFIYLIFPGTGTGYAMANAEIRAKAETAFEDWGGENRLYMLFKRSQVE